jgi:rubrerythrin
MITKDVAKMHFDAKKDFKVVNAMPSPPLSADMKPLDGLVVAIKKELEAMQMYSQLAALSTETEQKFLFTQLANMESGHKARLEDLYTNMAFPEVW